MKGYTAELKDQVICVDVEGPVENIAKYCETLVEDVSRQGFDVERFPVVYRISGGIWERLLVRDGRFVGYQSLGETLDRAEATDLALRAFRRWRP